ncbi:unnamed protein product [Mytilus edulis]|uniref:Reverse transcriptase domain-containing protein n=2 Tax=Mytilus TaxID=6548 RepID=A0A8S3TNB1_MYTED|nr:unnamed protein product [Mytilus edulis]
MVLICSFNCNGLKNVNNFQNFVSVLYDRRATFALLQETFWDKSYVDGIQNMYEGKIYECNGYNSRQGVAIMVANSVKDKTKLVYKDDEGRFIHVSYETDGQIFNFVSVYAPNNCIERARYFKFVNSYIENLQNVIIGGDFNTTLSNLDKGGKSKHCIDEAYRELNKTMCNCNIYDVWRARNECKKIFSWKRICNNILQQSRIDYFLISKSLSPNVQNVYYNETSFSDHTYVFMNFNFCVVERGPGIWVLNNTVLSNVNYVKRVKEIIVESMNCSLYDSEPLIWWDNLKYRIKRYSQVFSSDLVKEKKREFFYIQNKIQRLCALQASGIDIDVTRLETLQLDLSKYELDKCKGAILRSKATWATEGDKNTKYFLNLEKYRQESNSVKELYNVNDEIVNDTDGILDIEYNFYKELYSCVEIETDKLCDFLQHVDKKVDDDDKEICDSDITFNEIAEALSSMSKNKSPGSDGLTTEFYCTFYDSLREILYKVFNAVYDEGILSRSMRSGVISLIFKKKGDKRGIKNYRPISLLQVDYKILARVMANRFKKVLPKIVSENQTCCIVGRDISNSIANVRDIITLVENDDMEGYIVKADQEKAFDRLSHEYMLSVLKKFGFGESFIKWITIFYNEINSSVKCNGFLTKYFAIKNGIRQGCPISALLYVLAAEPLQCMISNNCNISGINIPMSEKVCKMFQHADDTTVTVSDKKSIDEVFNVFELYGKCSGAKINRQKSEIMPIGKGCMTENEQNCHGLKICENEILLLGVYIGKNEHVCNELNWRGKLNKIKMLLNMWIQRKLTIHGRVNVITSLLMSRLWYNLFVTSMPEWAIEEMKRLCVNFVWNGGAHLVQYNTIICDKNKGGLQLPDIKSKICAFRLKFLARFLNEDYKVIWKDIFRYFISKVLNMKLAEDIVFMSLKDKYMSCIPVIYKEMLKSFCFIRENVSFDYTVENIYNQPLFCNSEILICGKTILWNDFIEAGIIQLKDICYEVKPGFLPLNAIVEIVANGNDEYDIDSIIKRYRSLQSALPELWTKTVGTEVYHRTNNRNIDINLNMNCKLVDFKMCSSKQLYCLVIDKLCQQPKSVDKWMNIFQDDESIMHKVWKIVNMFWKPSLMTELDFKIAHCCIFTNERLLKMKLVDNDLCDICCNEIEDIMHLFIKCSELYDFHQYLITKVELLLDTCDSDQVNSVVYEQIFMLGLTVTINGVNASFVNFMLSVARYCIFRRRNLVKNNVKNIDILRFFQYTLKHYVTYFNEYLCQMKNMSNIFEKHFLLHNSILQKTDSDVIIFDL